MRGFEDLEVWKRSVDLSVAVYRELGASREFGFRDQITRCALSIPSNIAEGMERDSVPDKIRFLEYARGSAGEFRTQVIVGERAEILDPKLARAWVAESRELSAMIQGLIGRLRSRQSRRAR